MKMLVAIASIDTIARPLAMDGKPIGTLHLGGGQNFHANFPLQAPYPEAFPSLCAVTARIRGGAPGVGP